MEDIQSNNNLGVETNVDVDKYLSMTKEELIGEVFKDKKAYQDQVKRAEKAEAKSAVQGTKSADDGVQVDTAVKPQAQTPDVATGRNVEELTLTRDDVYLMSKGYSDEAIDLIKRHSKVFETDVKTSEQDPAISTKLNEITGAQNASQASLDGGASFVPNMTDGEFATAFGANQVNIEDKNNLDRMNRIIAKIAAGK